MASSIERERERERERKRERERDWMNSNLKICVLLQLIANQAIPLYIFKDQIETK